MTDSDDVVAARPRQWLRLFAFGTLTLFLTGAALGFTLGQVEDKGRLDATDLVILGFVAIAILVFAWLFKRELRGPAGEEPLTRKERLNRNILFGCGALGGVIGLVLSVAGEQGIAGGGVFSNAPLPTWVAALMVLILVGVLPVISYFWHRTVDEQEADAYKTGALWAFYVYSIGAPAWWLSWRGGFAPEPSGIAIFFATMLTMLIVWTGKKYF